MDQQSTRTDITVNVEGLWLLQALLDIRHVAPELRCRPFVSTESMDWLNEHPGMEVMREQGIVVEDKVNDQVAERMRVLAAPDLEVIALLSRASCATASSNQRRDRSSRSAPATSPTTSSVWCWHAAERIGCRRCGSPTKSPSTTWQSPTPVDRGAGVRRARVHSPRRTGADQRGQRAAGRNAGSHQGVAERRVQRLLRRGSATAGHQRRHSGRTRAGAGGSSGRSCGLRTPVPRRRQGSQRIGVVTQRRVGRSYRALPTGPHRRLG
ncbi:espG family protein [Mycobacterium xenopi 3993]|nr:espG family protein [Mycobacterium xenopi 3993]